MAKILELYLLGRSLLAISSLVYSIPIIKMAPSTTVPSQEVSINTWLEEYKRSIVDTWTAGHAYSEKKEGGVIRGHGMKHKDIN
jgi:hypothetical protein